MFNRRTPLIHMARTVTGTHYLQNIIIPIIELLRNEMAAQFVFMDDKAGPHRTRVVQEILEHNNITRLEWPAMSPDMKPIENRVVDDYSTGNKAYDVAHRENIIEQAVEAGIGGNCLNFIKNFLQNRTFKVLMVYSPLKESNKMAFLKGQL